MKTKRKTVKVRPHPKKKVSAAKVAAKRVVRRKRPLHKSIALHPISVLFLMCVGVFLALSTFHSVADSYTVGATVPAGPLTVPAVITTPSDNQQVSPQNTTVSGTCPYISYVDLTNNGVFAGTAICTTGGTFQFTVTLNVGANVLNAQDYNITNSPGPTSPSITVYYTPPAPASGSQTAASAPAPVVVVAPVALQVLQLDNGIPYVSSSVVQIVSNLPTLTGIAPPFSLILVTVHSNPYYCQTYANSQGYWSCTFDELLPTALHNVYIYAVTPAGQHLNFAPFQMKVVSVSPNSEPVASKFIITANYKYATYVVGQPVSINVKVNGGPAPYASTVSWGDGTSSTYLWQSPGVYTISHTYSKLNASFGAETVKIETVDASGGISSLQTDAVLRNPAYVAPTTKPTGIVAVLDKIRPWLVILWPGYVVVQLMVFAFWLGERQEVIAIVKRHRKQPHHFLRS